MNQIFCLIIIHNNNFVMFYIYFLIYQWILSIIAYVFLYYGVFLLLPLTLQFHVHLIYQLTTTNFTPKAVNTPVNIIQNKPSNTPTLSSTTYKLKQNLIYHVNYIFISQVNIPPFPLSTTTALARLLNFIYTLLSYKLPTNYPSLRPWGVPFE